MGEERMAKSTAGGRRLPPPWLSGEAYSAKQVLLSEPETEYDLVQEQK
jgi:hypothetical protein